MPSLQGWMVWQGAVQDDPAASDGGSQLSPGSTTPLPQPLSQIHPSNGNGEGEGKSPEPGQPQAESRKPFWSTREQSPSALDARSAVQRARLPANDWSS